MVCLADRRNMTSLRNTFGLTMITLEFLVSSTFKSLEKGGCCAGTSVAYCCGALNSAFCCCSMQIAV